MIEAFEAAFGELPEIVVRAPGRVNLIGEHLDYNGGPVLPMAIVPAVRVAARFRVDGRVRLRSQNFDGTYEGPVPATPTPGPGWANYCLGVLGRLGVSGLDVLIDSSIPAVLGLSSSAALEVATGLAAGASMEPLELALLCQRAENEFVGMRCGIMDQAAVACCRSGHAMWLDCGTLQSTHVPLGGAVAVVVAHCGVYRGLSASAYNERRQDCEAAARLLGSDCLARVTLDEVERFGLPDRLLRRTRHVVTECARVAAVVEALRLGRYADVGRALNDSHTSLRDDYEVSCPELDDLTDCCRRFPGCWGFRVTGAGFGGCTVSLVEAERAPAMLGWLAAEFYAPRGLAPLAFASPAAAGAEVEGRPYVQVAGE